MTQPFLCPQCETPQQTPADSVEFCFRCRFPLMLIAGKYRLEKLLAEGGQGAVYLARHTELDLDPLRVIKIVKAELFERLPSLSERFRREVQVTSALSQRCQHIVRIYDDFGEIPALGQFYVMEHLEGRPLADLLKDPNDLPDIKVCLHIFYQLCDAMRFAHREDIIHRDLKPDNLMLITFEDEPLFLKVLDFGIAWPSGEQNAGTPRLTQGVVGTPEYMAPEQLTGKPVDARADLYAMGVILYEMLTGKTPHKLSGAGQEAFFELVMTRLKEDPLPPSEVRPERDIHPALDRVVMTLLRRPPDERYSGIEALKTALREAEREIRRTAKAGLQDTSTDFDEQALRRATQQFGGAPSEALSGRGQTAGYHEPADDSLAGAVRDPQITPLETSLPELIPLVSESEARASHSPTDPNAEAFSLTDERTHVGTLPPEAEPSLAQIRDAASLISDTPRETGLPEMLQMHLEMNADEMGHLTQPAAPLPTGGEHPFLLDPHGHAGSFPIDEDTLKGGEATALQEPELPIFSEEEYHEETAISDLSHMPPWGEQHSIGASVQGGRDPHDGYGAGLSHVPPGLPDDATKESPSFRLRADAQAQQGPRKVLLIAGLLVVLVAGGVAWWLYGKMAQRTGSMKDQAGSVRQPPRRAIIARRAAVTPRVDVPQPPRRRLPSGVLPIRPLPLDSKKTRARPVRIGRGQRRHTTRRRPTRRVVTRRKPPTSGCPQTTPQVHWLHVKLQPGHVRMRYLLGSVMAHQRPANDQRCIGLHTRRVRLELRARGYRTCLVTLSRRTQRRLLLQLKRLRLDTISTGDDNYCQKSW